MQYADLTPFDPERPQLPAAVTQEVEIQVKYAGYLARQEKQVAEFKKEESRRLPQNLDYTSISGLRLEAQSRRLPQNLDYTSISGLRLEAQEKLQAIRPISIGQAGRISGVSPADIAVLLIYLETHPE